jgi:hypothetical protein
VGDPDAHAPTGSGDDRDLAIEDSHRIHPSVLLTVTATWSYSAIRRSECKGPNRRVLSIREVNDE